MHISRTTDLLRNPHRRSPADDAYTAWFNAEQRCTEALVAWRAATAGQRAAAFHAYRFELALEEMAAEHLERFSEPKVAA